MDLAALNPFRRPPLSAADESRIVSAIRDAEAGNRGEVRVHVERRCPSGKPIDRAEELFHALGMDETDEDTGVLLYIAADDRTACVWAGAGVYGARDEGFWDEVVDEVAGGFVSGAPGRGIATAVRRIGRLLRELVPGEDTAGNELPDEVSMS